MALEPVPPPLTGFKRLNTATYIYEPVSINYNNNTTTTTTSSPDLILLPAWLDAAPRHIAKYTRGYNALYPTARILLITTSLHNVTFSTRRAETARLGPALSLLASLPANTRILLHSFSNGGAYTVHLLARMCLAHTGHELPLGAQIFDSAPGQGQYGRTMTALATGLPRRPWVAYVGSLMVLHVFLAVYWAVKMVTGGKNKIQVMNEGLLDGEVWDGDVPRCLVYSKEDKMVVWEDVLEHAERARNAGWKRVSVEEFQGSPHCGHLLVDEERYWGIVKRVWGES